MTPENPRRRSLISIVALLMALALAPAPAPAVGRVTAKTPNANSAARPNILIVVSDDQAMSTFSRYLMPTVFSQLVDQGVLFNRFYLNTSQCCPSRSEILTGLYEHHTGVDTNSAPLDRPILPQALHDLGYRTMLAGKFLNSMPCTPRAEFDRWVCSSGGTLVDPSLNVDGTLTDMKGYTTDILAGFVQDFISATPPDQPFFVMYTPKSPHRPANDYRYESLPVEPLRGPSYDQETRTGRLPQYEQRPPLPARKAATLDTWYQRMSHATRSLDDSVGTVLSSLGDRADNTLVFYLSDNGYLYGEHRLWAKRIPYEESFRVPLIIRYPPLILASDSFATDALVQNVDIAPTIADVLGIPWGADGRSLVPLLTRQATSVRDSLLIEHCEGPSWPCLTGGSGEPGENLRVPIPPYWAVVTPNAKLVEYDTNEREMYNLANDPNELTNLAGLTEAADQEAELHAELDAVRSRPPPETTIVTGPESTAHARAFTFRYFSQSRLATYACRLDSGVEPGAWQPCDGQSLVVGPLVDGDYTFEVAGTDETGAADPTPAVRSFSIHATGPDVTIDSGPPAHVASPPLAFSFSSSRSNVTFQCALGVLGAEPAWTSCDPATGETYDQVPDGLWSFKVRAVDPAGGATDPPAERLVNVDDAGPSMIFTEKPPRSTNDTTARFAFHPNEATTGAFTCQLDTSSPADCSEGVFSGEGLAEGGHTMTVTGTDEVGNVGSTALPWQVDTTPPTLQLDAAPSGSWPQDFATFRLLLSEPSTISCTLDGLTILFCPKRPAFYALADGSHTFTASAVDRAGNDSNSVTATWIQDTVPPQATGPSPRW